MDTRKIDKCKVCGNDFFKEPLLKYKNMPSAAQYLPDVESLEKDRGVNLEVCQCSGCGLVQLNNDHVPYYREVIRASAFSGEMKDFRTKQFEDFAKKYSLKGKKIIEIGCGSGEYLSVMQKCGVETYGLEQKAESVQQCIMNGLKVSKGFVENRDYKINEAPFDAFFTLSFLEHLPNPNETLQGIRNNLTDGGVGIVEVPNFDMVLRKNLFSEFIRDHLFYFTEDTLNATLRQNGFEILECNEIWHDYLLSAIVRKRGELNIAPFYEHQKKLKAEIERYVGRFKDKGVAIWGAGHQALTIISLTEMADKIRYVVDSATFKQGKYTPATHIPIVSPEMLDYDPVEAIIVISGSYSNEVSKIIRRKYKSRLEDKVSGVNVAILKDFGLEEV